MRGAALAVWWRSSCGGAQTAPRGGACDGRWSERADGSRSGAIAHSRWRCSTDYVNARKQPSEGEETDACGKNRKKSSMLPPKAKVDAVHNVVAGRRLGFMAASHITTCRRKLRQVHAIHSSSWIFQACSFFATPQRRNAASCYVAAVCVYTAHCPLRLCPLDIRPCMRGCQPLHWLRLFLRLHAI
ncbi:hypothetical protein FH972_023141 [Carpinus fangiana]|uniref:Uncharacterized protein n=1 Tax=Carpinus fangiana TaxID=176857 RepID=A0A5N6KUT7_9ROSI|nr:hypothetical protein FH972_023141 [Carpinus fangiana]